MFIITKFVVDASSIHIYYITYTVVMSGSPVVFTDITNFYLPLSAVITCQSVIHKRLNIMSLTKIDWAGIEIKVLW